MKNIEKADLALKKIRETKGIYASPIMNYIQEIKHDDRNGLYKITIELPSDQLGGDRCCRSITTIDDRLKMIPVIAFIDAKEFNGE